MDIAGLRVRITIQENGTAVDEYGNHKAVWKDWFSCWATASANGKSAEETEKAATTREAGRLDLTVRWSPEIAAVSSKQHRILMAGRIYNIISIDDMGSRHNSRKFHTVLTER